MRKSLLFLMFEVCFCQILNCLVGKANGTLGGGDVDSDPLLERILMQAHNTCISFANFLTVLW